MPRWVVTAPDGRKFRGIEAANQAEALQLVQAQTASSVRSLRNPDPDLSKFFQTLPGETANSVKEMLIRNGWSETDATRKADQIGATLAARLPSSWKEFLLTTLPPLIAGGIWRSPMRSVGTFFKTAGTVAGARGVLGAGLELASPESGSPIATGITEAVKGVPAGIGQALAGLVAPSRAFSEAQRGARAIQKDLTPALARMVNPEKPATLFDPTTIKKMTQAAGKSLDEMEQKITTELTGIAGKQNWAGRFQLLRERVKVLQDVGERARMAQEPPERIRLAFRTANNLRQQISRLLVAAGKPELAEEYVRATTQYAKDRGVLRVLKVLQHTQSVRAGLSGASPLSLPNTAEAVEAFQAPELGAAARAGFAGILAATRHPFMALHFLPRMSQRGPLSPLQILTPRGTRLGAQIGGPVAGIGTGFFQQSVLDAPTPDEPNQEKLESEQ